jgi:hypothetical protein
MRVFTNNGPHSLYIVLFDFSNAAPKFNHLGKFTFRRDAWLVLLLYFLYCIHRDALSFSMKHVVLGGDPESIKAWQKMTLDRKPQPAWLEMYTVDNILRFDY